MRQPPVSGTRARNVGRCGTRGRWRDAACLASSATEWFLLDSGRCCDSPIPAWELAPHARAATFGRPAWLPVPAGQLSAEPLELNTFADSRVGGMTGVLRGGDGDQRQAEVPGTAAGGLCCGHSTFLSFLGGELHYCARFRFHQGQAGAQRSGRARGRGLGLQPMQRGLISKQARDDRCVPSLSTWRPSNHAPSGRRGRPRCGSRSGQAPGGTHARSSALRAAGGWPCRCSHCRESSAAGRRALYVPPGSPAALRSPGCARSPSITSVYPTEKVPRGTRPGRCGQGRRPGLMDVRLSESQFAGHGGADHEAVEAVSHPCSLRWCMSRSPGTLRTVPGPGRHPKVGMRWNLPPIGPARGCLWPGGSSPGKDEGSCTLGRLPGARA